MEPFRQVFAAGGGDRAYRVRIATFLALALALDYADRSALGAVGPELKRAFGASNTEFGLIGSAFGVVGALATVPAGIAVDRTRRTVLLAGAIGAWTLAMGATGAATSLAMLLGARTFLGAAAAVVRPALSSIAGDVYEPAVRGRALAVIGTGELVGDGVGFLMAGALVAVFGWRGVFFALGAVGAGLALWGRRLREPERTADGEPVDGERSPVAELAREAGVEPAAHAIVGGDAASMPLGEAVRYVLRVRTQLLVMLAGAIGSLFFAGLRTFIVVFAVKAYGVSTSVADLAILAAGLGALVGVVAGGRLGDSLVARGAITGRLQVATGSYLLVIAALVPAFLIPSLWLALPAYFVGAAALAAPNPVLDAVRLDVIHPRLRGRAEGIRTVLLIAAEAGAPIAFGVLADRLGGRGAGGLRLTFLLTLSTLACGSLLLHLAGRSYPAEARAAELHRGSAG